MFNSFLDNIAMPVARAVGAGDPVDPRWIARQTTDMGLLSTGGLGSIIGAERQLLGSYPTRPGGNTSVAEDVINATWPIKMIAQGLGSKTRGELGMAPSNPYVDKTTLEKALTHPTFGLPFRKVRAQNEIQMARINYRKLQSQLKARYLSEQVDGDQEEMDLIKDNMQEVADALKSLTERERN